MRRLIFIMSFGLVLLSCKKDKLEDGKEILIGKWSWVYSEHTYYICLGIPQDEIINPETEGVNYSVEFLKKGIVKFYENDEVTSRDRVVFDQFGDPSGYGSEYTSFSFYLNNKAFDVEYLIAGAVSADTLIFKRLFPFELDPCEKHINYFVKE